MDSTEQQGIAMGQEAAENLQLAMHVGMVRQLRNKRARLSAELAAELNELNATTQEYTSLVNKAAITHSETISPIAIEAKPKSSPATQADIDAVKRRLAS